MSFKHSKYNIPVQIEENIFIIFNTLTQGLLEVNSREYDEFLNLKTESKKVLDKFIEYGFWIPDDYNELDELQVLHRTNRYANDLINVTIKTTNACNFLCSYCYQDHVPEDLNNETIKKVVNYFEDQIENKGISYIFVHWFGGEPLLNIDAILEIENYLKGKLSSNRLRGFKSALTSNGYLLTEDVIKKISQTEIQSIQITVDGIKEQHNTSRMLPTGEGTFDTIISNIKRCQELIPHMKIIIRLNVNKKNHEVEEFLRFLKNNNLKKDKIELHFSEAQKHDISYTDEEIFYNDLREFC